MAHMTENTNLQRALLRKIEQSSRGRVVIQEGKRVDEMRMGEGGRSVGLKLGDRWVRGGVVVGADGFNSPVRKFSGIDSFGHGYDTHAIVATLHHSPIDNHTAFQRFLPTGPIAFLPLSSDSTTMVWSTTPKLAEAYKALGSERLTMMVNLGFFMDEKNLQDVNAHVLASHAAGEPVDAQVLSEKWEEVMTSLTTEQARSLPPPIASVAPRSIASFPLKLSHAESYIGDRTVLVGDAAHTIHPLAGQGLNMGLADVKVLGEVWEAVRRQGGDLGESTSLPTAFSALIPDLDP
jgi:ubiquinone biosynthesis monooxygenase Coq6